MATLPSTHNRDNTSSSSIPLEGAELSQPPRHVKGVKVVPMYHPRMGYLHILAYAACNLVSRLPTEGPTASDSEAHSIATPSPPSNWRPLPPITEHQEKSSTSSHRFISASESNGVLAPASSLAPPPLNERRLRSHVVRLPVPSLHPYKDSSYGKLYHRNTIGLSNFIYESCSFALLEEDENRSRYLSNRIPK